MIRVLVKNLQNIARELKTNKPANLAEWRQWSANAVFMAAIILAPVALLSSLPTYLAENRYGLIVFDLVIIIVLLIRLIDKWGSSRFWMVIWLVLIYIMMTTFFITLGPHYARSAWLVFFSVMTALFFGTAAGAAAVFINVIMLLSLYFLMGAGNAAWTLVYADPFPKYLMFVINTAAIALLPTLLAGFMLNRLDRTHGFQQQAMQDFQGKNEKLKLAEETVRESETRYRTLFESAGDAIFLMKGDSFTQCNQKTLGMFGCRRDEIIGHSPVEFSPSVQPDGKNSSEKAMEKISAALDGNLQVFDWQHKKKDGTIFATEVSLNRVRLSTEDFILAIVRDITDRKKAEEKLRESESYNKLLFRDSRIPLIVMDPKTNKYLDCNQAAINIYGHKNREETLSKTPLDVSTATQYNGEQSSNAAHKKISEALEKGSNLFEWRHQRPNGEIWDAEVHLMSFEHKNSKLLQFSLFDITERKQIENHRKHLDRINKIIISSKQLEQMFTILLDELITIFDCDRAFLIFPADPFAESYRIPMERTRKKWSGAAVQGEKIPMDPATSSLFEKILKSKKSYTVGYGTKDDVPKQLVEQFHVKSIISLAIHPIIGKPWLIGMHQCSHGKIWKSEEKELFNDIGRRFADGLSSLLFYQELRQAKNYLSNIIDSMPSVLVGVDTKGKVTQWNSKAVRTTGLLPEAAAGQPLDKVIPRLADEMELIHRAMQTYEVKIDSRRVYHEKGETLFEDVTIYPLIENGVEGAVVRIDDVTEQVRIEEMMVQSEKMLSIGGLAAGMAHEINNPLAGIMQTSNVMSRRLTDLEMPANKKVAKEIGIKMDDIKAFMEKRDILSMVTTIENSGQRVAQIVDNMLSFARKSEALVSSHNPAELLDKILDLAATDYDLKKQYDFKAIKIVKEYEENLPMVPCEGAKIQQVLLNILRNGAQAMQEVMEKNPDYKPKFILRLFRETGTSMLRIEIEDNGPGMDEKIRKRVFEPFYTTKPVGDGTGLGLSVSYFIIVENHGGEMAVESVPGSGAKFIIRMPLDGKKP